jgi:hypothetical protein|tara:strand:- start:2958 stop:3452 length:495 start_codon:yes stop_codon:yes gene_type:complete
MNIKVNDICKYKGTEKTCLILAILGNNAWVRASAYEDDDHNGHVIPLESLEAPKLGGRVPVSTISANIVLYFNTLEAAKEYKEYITLENEMVLFMKTCWEASDMVLDWSKNRGKQTIEDSYGEVMNSYAIKDYSFIALPTLTDVEDFRNVFSDSDIMKVLRRPQ